MEILNAIPEDIFQIVGTIIGLLTCGVIFFQFVKECRDPRPSSMGLTYIAGWLVVFVFWLMYGIRFGAIAIWLTNSIAAMIQIGLLICVLRKRNKPGA